MSDIEWRQKVLDAMEDYAKKMHIQGVAAVTALMGKGDLQFTISCRVVGTKERSAQPKLGGNGDAGANFVGLATSMLAEMISTWYSSGAQTRPLRNGELGCKGGQFLNYKHRYYFLAFSSDHENEDMEIVEAGIRALTD